MHPTRQKLLDTGLAIAADKGLRGLTVRELAAAAEVNLGTFVYHFGNRDAFIDELVELWYAPSMTSSRPWQPKAPTPPPSPCSRRPWRR